MYANIPENACVVGANGFVETTVSAFSGSQGGLRRAGVVQPAAYRTLRMQGRRRRCDLAADV
ncbi:MAG TPA: hypothetical protein DD666_11635, partial [Advenella kashmirensis]|nr:hypothetical protein [Advenella kashmirensis]